MRLILDTNILISALIKDSATRSLLLSPYFEFYLPEYALEEIQRYIQLIVKKSGLNESEIRLLLTLLLERIKIVSGDKISPYLKEAEKIIGHIDKKDIPFIALALSCINDGIWTNDTHFEEQDRIKIWKTQDILKFVRDKETGL